MTKLSSLEALVQLYDERGDAAYGEGVSQLDHALQCAALAQADGGAPSLVAAALLHDVGHLFEDEEAASNSDGRHEIVGAQALRGLFGEDVRAPIALHVAAKRYLCFKEPAYLATLSAASITSLKLQGGPFDSSQAEGFERRSYWRQAVALRRYDDLGKRNEPVQTTFAEFLPLLAELQASRQIDRRDASPARPWPGRRSTGTLIKPASS